MTRLPVLFAVVGGVLAYACADRVGDIAGFGAMVTVLFGYLGFGMAVAYFVGWPRVEVTEGRREP